MPSLWRASFPKRYRSSGAFGVWELFETGMTRMACKVPQSIAFFISFRCSNTPILFQSLAKELPRTRESWAPDLEFREPAQANAEISAADAYRWIWKSLWRRQSLSMHLLWQNLCEIEQPDGTQTGQAWAGLARSRILSILSILSNRALDFPWRLVPVQHLKALMNTLKPNQWSVNVVNASWLPFTSTLF